LRAGGEPHIEYRDLAARFDGRVPTLAETRQAVLDIRRQKSMVIDPKDPNSRSAGSFFKNPIVEHSTADELSNAIGEPVPYFRAPGGSVKIPAAWLIEKAGFSKGYILGNAGLSANHSLAIINRGEARSDDIIALKELIRSAVFEKFGVDLVPEPVLLGFGD
jgi:UDP-N-acetylmuramate dehydrogenase